MKFNLDPLLSNGKFWFSLYALVQVIAIQFVPSITPETWQAIDALLVVVVSTYTAGTVVGTNRARAAYKALAASRYNLPVSGPEPMQPMQPMQPPTAPQPVVLGNQRT